EISNEAGIWNRTSCYSRVMLSLSLSLHRTRRFSMNSDFRKSARQNAFVGALAVGATAMFAAETGMAAAVVQPDLQVGASYVDNGGFTGEDDVSSAGAEVRAKLDIGWVNERGSVTLVPMVRATRYSDDALSEREEQRLTFN